MSETPRFDAPAVCSVDIHAIQPGTMPYAAAAKIRYEALYAPWELPHELIADTDGRTYEHYAAYVGDALVGYARLLLDDGGEGVIAPGECKVFQVSVAERARRTGVGAALMHAVEARAREAGAGVVVLDARDYAVGFYERRGYEVYGEEFISPRTHTVHRRMRKRVG